MCHVRGISSSVSFSGYVSRGHYINYNFHRLSY